MENFNKSLVFNFLTLATSSISFCNGNLDVLCKASERQALFRIKQDLKDPINLLSTWNAKGDCCMWTGVSCDNLTYHVLELHLSFPYSTSEMHTMKLKYW